MFQFNNLADFIAMGGYGVFVWSSYAIAAALAIYLYVAPLRRHRQLQQRQRPTPPSEFTGEP